MSTANTAKQAGEFFTGLQQRIVERIKKWTASVSAGTNGIAPKAAAA
jgi:hypothetical protein